jgi:hypothetical protein
VGYVGGFNLLCHKIVPLESGKEAALLESSRITSNGGVRLVEELLDQLPGLRFLEKILREHELPGQNRLVHLVRIVKILSERDASGK